MDVGMGLSCGGVDVGFELWRWGWMMKMDDKDGMDDCRLEWGFWIARLVYGAMRKE